jgi:uncharacterized protein
MGDDDQEFEWDTAKARENITRGRPSFERAAYVFGDPDYIELLDLKHSAVEDRFKAIGVVDGECLFTAFTWRGARRRLISVRLANKQERAAYGYRPENDGGNSR